MKRSLKMLISMLLCFAMIAGASVSMISCNKDPGQTPGGDSTDGIKVGGSAIIGSTTELSGSDFASSTWGNNAADKDVRDLTNGYACVQQTKAGEYVWDTKVVVKSYEIIENDDGSKTFKVTINDNLKYSDGSAITAKNYLVTTLVFSTPVAAQAAGKDHQSAMTIVGYDTFKNYNGTAAEGTTKYLSGLDLLTEIFHRDVCPDVACEIDEDGIDSPQAVEE